MSSLGRTISQVPSRSKYLTVSRDYEGNAPTQKDFDAGAAANLPGVSVVGSTVSVDTMDHFYDYFYGTGGYSGIYSGDYSCQNFDTGDVLKDMGKSIYIFVEGVLVLEYRLVQRVADSQTQSEGVPPNYPNNDLGQNNKYNDYAQFYVPVFSSQDYNTYRFTYVWVFRSG